MAHGQNTTYVTYTYARGTANVRMVLKPLCTYRDHHALTKGGYHVNVEPYAAPWPDGQAVKVQPLLDRQTVPTHPFRIYSSGGTITPDGEWWWSFHLAEEKKRGLANQEDLFAAATISADLRLGNTLAVVFTAEDDHPAPWHDALQAEQQRQRDLLEQAELPPNTPEWIQQLMLAADQFVVSRNIDGEPGKSLLAGYPWFSDWGRDTMIALPGLTLATGRRAEAAAILQTYAKYVDQGMLPNRFPDAGQAPEYNTVDATLWYFQSVYAYYKACGRDHPAIKELYPVLIAILKWHIGGTRFNIRMDPADGLLHAGEPGLQLTWMDAKIDDWVVTPRVGKPVEINALWVNALRIAAELAAELGNGEDAQTYHDMAERAHASFQARFWYSGGYLYDVIDGPEGDDDPTLRPNQIFAVSLPFPLLEGEQAKAVVDICARELVVSYGLRSLAPDETDYVGYYGGDRLQRDGAYHQGTVWSWLIGPFVSAHYRVYGNARTAMTYLEPMADHLYDHGLGTVSEIYDGDPPHVPHGCIAQAWGVAEVLRVWRALQG
jgi:predicted glycogen debranching enzyme